MAAIDFPSDLYLMIFKGQCHYINEGAQTGGSGRHNGAKTEQHQTSSDSLRRLVSPRKRWTDLTEEVLKYFYPNILDSYYLIPAYCIIQ